MLRVHNANVIQSELAALFTKAKKAGVQIEVHHIVGEKVANAVGLYIQDNPDEDGMFVFASPDPDLTPEIVL